MTRTITAQEIKPGMKIKFTAFGWENTAEVFEVKRADDSDKDYVAVWAKGETGTRGGLDCIKKFKVVEVLEEAPLPLEPAVGSTVMVDDMLFNRVDADDIGWRSVRSGGYYGWRELHEKGEVEVLFDIASTKPKLKVGDKLEVMPEDGSEYEGYVFHVRSSPIEYMVYSKAGWGWTFDRERAKAGIVTPYSRSAEVLTDVYAPLTVVSTPEGK